MSPKPIPTKIPIPPTERLWDYRDAARFAGVTVKTIQNWIAARRISRMKIGKICRLDPEQFKAELRKFEVKAA